MKKKLIVLCVFLFSLYSIYANVNSVIVITSSKNISDGEKQWLLDLVRDKFISNFQTYSDFQFVSSNTDKIKQLQRESEKAAYDSNSMIEIGKLTTAGHAFFLDVTKTGKNYLISVQFADLTTGRNIAQSISPSKDKIEDLYNTTGCAVNEVTIDLCDKLDIPLTIVQKKLLMKGNVDLSESEKSESYKQEINDYNNLINNLNKELKKIEISSDVNAVSEETKLKARMAMAEEKKKQAEEQQARFLEIQKAKEAEFEANAKRSEAQINKINELSRNANVKIKELRQLKKDSASVLGFLNQIESKKAAIVQIDEDVVSEQKEIANKIKQDYKIKIDEIKSAKWRISDTLEDGKTVTDEAKNRRTAEIKKVEDECFSEINKQTMKIEASVKASKNEILKDIQNDLKELKSKTFYANSLDGTLQVDVRNFDGQKKGWKAVYSVLCDGVTLATCSAYIKYSDVEKLVPSGLIYEDAVDMYDSLFKCNEPFLVYGVSYTITADATQVSTYDITISELKVYSVSKVNVKKNSALSGENFSAGYEKVVTKQMSKQYDYDTKSRIVAEKKDFLFENLFAVVGWGVAYSPYFSSEYNSEENINISPFVFLSMQDLFLSLNYKLNKNQIFELGIGWTPIHCYRLLFSVNCNIGYETGETIDNSLCLGGSSTLMLLNLIGGKDVGIGVAGSVNGSYYLTDSSFRWSFSIGGVLTQSERPLSLSDYYR